MNRNVTVKLKSAALPILMLSCCMCLAGQEKAQDRRKFLSPSTPVSDDPRRIPVKPGPMGPDRVLVLRVGSIFDVTGALAKERTRRGFPMRHDFSNERVGARKSSRRSASFSGGTIHHRRRGALDGKHSR